MTFQWVSEAEKFHINRWASQQPDLIGDKPYLSSGQAQAICNCINEGRTIKTFQNPEISVLSYSLREVYDLGKAYLLRE